MRVANSRMPSSQPLVTVVTPVYNGAEYLSECIDSVLNQTYTDLEYVIVDNWSTDDSGVIAERYAAADDRVIVRRPAEHLEIIQNWNFPLADLNPNSTYTKIVHADDWLTSTCLERMVDLAERSPSVGLIGAFRLEQDKPSLYGLPPDRSVFSGREVGAAALEDRISVFGSPTQLLIRSELIRANRPFYDEKLLHADKDVCFRLLLECDFGFVTEILSFTRRHNESKTSAVFTLGTHSLEKLELLRRYGESYLGERYPARWKEARITYYRFLAKRLLDGYDPQFWRFQRDGLRDMGLSLNVGRLCWEVLLRLANLPETARRIVRRFRASANA